MIVEFDFKGQDSLFGAASQRGHSVKGDPGDCFAEVVEAFVPGLFSRFSLNDLRNQRPFRRHRFPESTSNCGIVRDKLGHDGQGALNGLLSGGNGLLLREKLFGNVLDREFSGFLLPQFLGQGLQPFLCGGGRFRAFLALEGRVEILQPDLVVTGQYPFP